MIGKMSRDLAAKTYYRPAHITEIAMRKNKRQIQVRHFRQTEAFIACKSSSTDMVLRKEPRALSHDIRE